MEINNIVVYILIGIPTLIFVLWLYSMIRYIILPNKKVIKGFFVHASRTIIIITIFLILFAIGALIYHLEVPKLYEYQHHEQYDKVDI